MIYTDVSQIDSSSHKGVSVPCNCSRLGNSRAPIWEVSGCMCLLTKLHCCKNQPDSALFCFGVCNKGQWSRMLPCQHSLPLLWHHPSHLTTLWLCLAGAKQEYLWNFTLNECFWRGGGCFGAHLCCSCWTQEAISFQALKWLLPSPLEAWMLK